MSRPKKYRYPMPKSLESDMTAFSIIRAIMREYKKRGLLNHMSLDIGVANGKHYAYMFFHTEDIVSHIDFYNRHLFRERWDELLGLMDEEVEKMRKESECQEKEEMEEAV